MKTLIALTLVNVAISGTTLAIVLFGARKVQTIVDEAKSKSNDALSKMREALNGIEL